MAPKERFGRIRRLFSRSKDYGRTVVNADQIEKEWGSIKDMAGSVLKPSQKAARQETFDNAMSRMKLGEADLQAAYKFQVSRIYIFSAGLALCMLLFIVFAFMSSWASAIGCLGVSFGMAALSFQASFRAMQIRQRELVPISYWIDHPNGWLPMSMQLPPRKSSKSNLPAKTKSSKR